MKGMNIGDKLYCYCNSNVGVNIDCTIGMFYIIENISFDKWLIIDKRLIIINNSGHYDWFSYDTNSLWYYGTWFYSNQDVRRLKLDKLNNL